MNAEQVRIALRKKFHDSRRYAIAEEVGLTTGFSHRRLDMVVLDCYYSNGFRIDGFEIKVSTNDLRRELADPEKHIAFYEVIDYYTIAAPAGVVDPLLDLIPKKWGILIVNENGSTKYKRQPLALEDRKADKEVPRGFLASLVRNIQARQPAAEELQAEHQRGFNEGREAEKQHRSYEAYMVSRRAEDLEEYDRLKDRLRLWGEDLNETIDLFEKFQTLNIGSLTRLVENTAKDLNKLAKKLKGTEENR